MKTSEIMTRFKNNPIYRALIGASRQIELCGWCPKEKDNNLNKHYYTCEIARKDGVIGCHKCIAEHFLIKAER